MNKPKAVVRAVSSAITSTASRTLYRAVDNAVDRVIDSVVHNAIYGEISSAAVRRTIDITTNQPQPTHITTEVNRVLSELG